MDDIKILDTFNGQRVMAVSESSDGYLTTWELNQIGPQQTVYIKKDSDIPREPSGAYENTLINIAKLIRGIAVQIRAVREPHIIPLPAYDPNGIDALCTLLTEMDKVVVLQFHSCVQDIGN